MSQVTVRHATPEDAAVLTRIYSQPETRARCICRISHRHSGRSGSRIPVPCHHAGGLY